MKKIVSKKLSGFSLIEILVVLMIIGLLTAVVAINVLPSQVRARADKALADIRIYEQALELYRLDMFSYPTSDERKYSSQALRCPTRRIFSSAGRVLQNAFCKFNQFVRRTSPFTTNTKNQGFGMINQFF